MQGDEVDGWISHLHYPPSSPYLLFSHLHQDEILRQEKALTDSSAKSGHSGLARTRWEAPA